MKQSHYHITVPHFLQAITLPKSFWFSNLHHLGFLWFIFSVTFQSAAELTYFTICIRLDILNFYYSLREKLCLKIALLSTSILWSRSFFFFLTTFNESRKKTVNAILCLHVLSLPAPPLSFPLCLFLTNTFRQAKA